MAIRTEPFVLNLGPVHPSTHGVFRMRAVMDGEVIVDLEPVFGYLHRGLEKLAEERTYGGIV
ncbi:MAG TPA: NADH-quinone oxidoreductase subunit D, partial [Dehalococcoidales bacterium]|nr:NADH-quinone oxidoreductase subunit D [Dehalococcoidales bacterium]